MTTNLATARNALAESDELPAIAAVSPAALPARTARSLAFEELREEVRRRGYTRPATGRLLFELALTLVVGVVGSAMTVVLPGWWKVLGTLVMTAGWLGVATNIHTATHGATSTRPWLNDAISYLYPLLFNLSATSWWKSHIAVHHRAPNVMGIDGDCDLMPMFAITRPQFEAQRGLRRVYYRLQWIVLPFLLPLDGFNRQFGSWKFLFTALRDPEVRRSEHWIDLAAMTGYWLLWWVVPIYVLHLPVGGVVGFHLLRMAMLGYALFITFGPGHFPAEAVCYTPESKPCDFFERQLTASMNFKSGPIREHFVGGLQFQVEHHLFPSVSHTYYPEIARLVEKFAREQGLPYHNAGWLSTIWKSYRVFFVPKDVIGDPTESQIQPR